MALNAGYWAGEGSTTRFVPSIMGLGDLSDLRDLGDGP